MRPIVPARARGCALRVHMCMFAHTRIIHMPKHAESGGAAHTEGNDLVLAKGEQHLVELDRKQRRVQRQRLREWPGERREAGGGRRLREGG